MVSMPQPNGTIYTFGKDVNLLWRHGILQVHLSSKFTTMDNVHTFRYTRASTRMRVVSQSLLGAGCPSMTSEESHIIAQHPSKADLVPMGSAVKLNVKEMQQMCFHEIG